MDTKSRALAALKTSISGACATPNTYQQAIESPQADNWRGAMNKEIERLVALGTFRYVSSEYVPKSTKILSGHWAYRLKQEPDKPDVYKAR